MSSDIVLSGNLDMLHSLYDFEPTYVRTIGFRTDAYFLLYQTNTKHKNWWEVISATGELGYIPSNYVEVVTVNPSFYLKFVDACLRHLKRAPAPAVAARLRELRRAAERLPDRNVGEGDGEAAAGGRASPAIDRQAVYEMVESVRINTQLSHEHSRVAVATVVQGLHELLPAAVFPYLSTILSHAQGTLRLEARQIEQTHDASRLKIIFSELTACKNDAQQRSWELHDDEDVIKEYLMELVSILSNADAFISKHVIGLDEYNALVTLIDYCQMEKRWSIRQLLLQAFGVLCSLDKGTIGIMLNSILPVELARDMMDNLQNIPKLNYSAILLTMIFSTGEPMPCHHQEFINDRFLPFLFVNIEFPPDTDIDDIIPDLFLNCLLSYNLQFVDLGVNPILEFLQNRDTVKSFYERILLLFNREQDPVKIFEHEPDTPNSVLKLFRDLLSRRRTASLFYSNDVKVLIDIVVRNLTDLSPGDSRRPYYLEILRRIMRNTGYDDERHRLDEILKCFQRICHEDGDLCQLDQEIIKSISHEFSDYFE